MHLGLHLGKTCIILLEYKEKLFIKNHPIYINRNCNCQTKNVIYGIFCSCGKLYVGKTTSSLNIRTNLHRQQITHPNYTLLPANEHMRNCGNNISITVLYVCAQNDILYLDNIENYFHKLLLPELNVDI